MNFQCLPIIWFLIAAWFWTVILLVKFGLVIVTVLLLFSHIDPSDGEHEFQLLSLLNVTHHEESVKGL